MSWLLPGTRVALLGDSHMEALGPRLRRLLEDRLGVRVVNVEARRGWSTRRFVQSGDVPRLTAGVDVAIVELGGNDAAAGIGGAAHAVDVKALLGQVRAPRVIWIGPGVTKRSDLEAARGPIRDAQREAVEGHGAAWIDGQPLTRESELRRDRIHFSGDGYTAWAGRLLPHLAKAPAGGLSLSWIAPAAFAGAAGLAAYAWWRARR